MVVRFLLGKFERDAADSDWRDCLLKPKRPFLLAFVVASGPLWCVIAAATSFEMLDRFLIPTCYGTHTVVNMYFEPWQHECRGLACAPFGDGGMATL